jgi:hypothetical protein
MGFSAGTTLCRGDGKLSLLQVRWIDYLSHLLPLLPPDKPSTVELWRPHPQVMGEVELRGGSLCHRTGRPLSLSRRLGGQTRAVGANAILGACQR